MTVGVARLGVIQLLECGVSLGDCTGADLGADFGLFFNRTYSPQCPRPFEY